MISQSRRAFLLKSGWTVGGLTVLSACSVIPPLPTFGKSDTDDILTWVQISPSGTVRFNLPRAEMGQGINTGLAQVVAEEMNLPLDQINCRYQSTQAMAPCQMTVGSQSVENYMTLTALAAASLRTTLAERAATRLSVQTTELTLTEGGFASANRKTISYKDLVKDDESVVEISADQANPELLSDRPADQLRVLGKTVTQVNVDRVVTGQETYSRDKQLAGLTFGAIARPPQLGATYRRFDAAEATKVAGVIQVVEYDGQIGVIAQTPMAASAALAAIKIDWIPLSAEEVDQAQQAIDVDDAISAGSVDHTLIDEGSQSANWRGIWWSGALPGERRSRLVVDAGKAPGQSAMDPRRGIRPQLCRPRVFKSN